MKRSRFTEAQIILVPREQEAGLATADVRREHGIGNATFYGWKAKFGGERKQDPAAPEGIKRMDFAARHERLLTKRLKQLEEENAKLKRLLADAMLDAVAMKDLL